MTARLRELGAEPQSADPAAYAIYARNETGKWADIIKRYGLAP
jgi:hypothetical protein